MSFLIQSWDRYRRTPRALRWVVATLLVGFAVRAVIDVHGRVGLARFHDAWAAKGVELRYDRLVEPQIAPEDNFYEAPLFVEYRKSAAEGVEASRFQVLDRKEMAGLTAYADERREYRSLAPHGSAFGWLLPLAANLVSPDENEYENAQTILDTLAPTERLLIEFAEAVRRPDGHQAWPVLDQNDVVMHPNSNSLVLEILRALRLRARAHLHRGNSQAALLDIQTMSAAAKHAYQSTNFLIDHLFAITFQGMVIDPIWEGLYLQLWNEEQLQALDEQLADVQIPSSLPEAVRHELADSEQMIRQLARSQANRREAVLGMGEFEITLFDPPGFEPIEIREWLLANVRAVYYRLAPAGAFLHEIRALQEPATLALVAPGGVPATTLTYDAYDRFRSGSGSLPTFLSFAEFVGNAKTYSSVLERSFEAQQTSELARIAIALEQYFLTHGGYPEDLHELVPRFLPVVFPDLYDPARTVVYRRVPENGRYRLYSVGGNQVDDGGQPEKRGGGKSGDLVWQYAEVPKLNP